MNSKTAVRFSWDFDQQGYGASFADAIISNRNAVFSPRIPFSLHLEYTVIMKKTVLLITLALFSPLSQSHAAFQSSDSKQFDTVAKDALAQGKKVMWIASAAWCGPCSELEEFLNTKKAALSPELDSFIILHTEQTQTEFSVFSDIGPAQYYYYPSIRLYDPLKMTWSSMGFSMDSTIDIVQLKDTLAAFINQGSLYAYSKAKYEAFLASGGVFGYKHGTLFHLDYFINAAMMELSLNDAAAAIKKVRQDAVLHPTQFDLDPAYGVSDMLDDVELVLLSRGFQLADLQAIDPDAFKSRTPGSWMDDMLSFALPLSQLWKNAKYSDAEKYCNTAAPLRGSYKQKLIGGVLCKELGVLAGTVNESSVQSFLLTLTDADKNSGASYLVSLSLLVGRFDWAVDFQNRYYASLIQTYGGSSVLKARIDASNTARLQAFAQKKVHP